MRRNKKLFLIQMLTNKTAISEYSASSATRTLLKILVWVIFFASLTYFIYSIKLFTCSQFNSNNKVYDFSSIKSSPFKPKKISISDSGSGSVPVSSPPIPQNQTILTPKSKIKRLGLRHIVFGIAGSSKLWEKRKEYIKLWWKPKKMRGFVWLDKPIKQNKTDYHLLPPVKISGNTSKFKYTNRHGDRSAIRISRIVSESFKLGLKNVRWFVMGDDDTIFVTENLIRVLDKYDHNGYYYIGSVSESHLQNIYFSYGMAYGGGGFAISYPLAKALVEIQDKCIQRYPELYGSDDRLQACMAELGVPLTKEPGFHQFDVYGNPLGLLAAHPVAPLVTIHHLDVIEPIFPVPTQVEAMKRLTVPMKLDPASLMQQSICYDNDKKWTISVSWGYVVQIQSGIILPREMEKPQRTFINWYKNADYKGFGFNTRPVDRNPCKNPSVYYIKEARYNSTTKETVSEYDLHQASRWFCKWNRKKVNVERVEVYKRPDPHLWNKSPRRNCCRILPSEEKKHMRIDVGPCHEGEYSQL